MIYPGFIDPPSPFSSLDEWQVFLAELETIKPRTADVKELIDQAKAQIAQLTGSK